MHDFDVKCLLFQASVPIFAGIISICLLVYPAVIGYVIFSLPNNNDGNPMFYVPESLALSVLC